MLKAKGINIARRTVAKYRGELGILPSNLRRVY
jgi:RNA polymerase sigma-54 factor